MAKVQAKMMTDGFILISLFKELMFSNPNLVAFLRNFVIPGYIGEALLSEV